MTVDAIERLDTSESLPVVADKERIGGWVPGNVNPLTDSHHQVVDVGTPIFDELAARFPRMSRQWWDERWQAVELMLRDEIECEHLDILATDVTSHSVDPSSVDLPELVEHVDAEILDDMPDTPAVAGQVYDERVGWVQRDADRAMLAAMVRERIAADDTGPLPAIDTAPQRRPSRLVRILESVRGWLP